MRRNAEGMQELKNRAENLQKELAKIEKTKKFYAGNSSISIEEISENHLHKLCKQSGIPKHFFTSQEQPPIPLYSKIINELQTNETNKTEYLNFFLSELLTNDSPDKFPSMRPFDSLSIEYIKNLKEEEQKILEKTVESYETKPHLKPENFLSADGFEEKLTILVRNKEMADVFFAETHDWVLPEQQHLALHKLKEEYSKIPSFIKEAFTKEHKEFLNLKEQLKEKLSILATQSTEDKVGTTAERKHGPQFHAESLSSPAKTSGRN
jgi:hypothetical protein